MKTLYEKIIKLQKKKTNIYIYVYLKTLKETVNIFNLLCITYNQAKKNYFIIET